MYGSALWNLDCTMPKNSNPYPLRPVTLGETQREKDSILPFLALFCQKGLLGDFIRVRLRVISYNFIDLHD